MAITLSPTQAALCNKMQSDYYNLVAPVKASKAAIKQAQASLDTFIRGMSFSDEGAIDNAIKQFENGVADALPGADLGAMNDIKEMIDRCSYMKNFAPAAAVIGSTNGVFDSIDNLISDAINNLGIQEFGAGQLASAIQDVLSGLGVPGGDILTDLIQQANELINCLSLICGYNVTAIESDLTNLLNDLKLQDDGTFDFDQFYLDAGLSPEEVLKIKRAQDAIENQKSSASDAIGNSVNAVKDLTKSLGGVF